MRELLPLLLLLLLLLPLPLPLPLLGALLCVGNCREGDPSRTRQSSKQ